MQRDLSDPVPRPGRSSPIFPCHQDVEKLTEQAPGFVSVVVIAEVAWVLRSKYKAQPLEIADAIERILSIDSLKVQNEQEVYHAVMAVRAGEGTLTDALICAIRPSVGCSKT